MANIAGVSVTTISRFFNHPETVEKKTYQKIEEAISATGFQPSLAARSLKLGDSRMFLLYVPDICNPFYSTMARTLQQLADENDFIMVICDTQEEVEKEKKAISLASHINASGIFAASVNANPEVMKMLSACKQPVIGLNAYPNTSGFDVVSVHHLGGTSMAVGHLVKLGHKRIAFAGGKKDSDIEISRLSGYRSGMLKANLKIDDSMIIERGFSEEDGYQAGRILASLDILPTAVCCANDMIAFGVIRGLNEQGIRVPEGISVTGMDNVPYAKTSNPRLTTVTNDGNTYAEIAFQMMMERINKSYSGMPRSVEISNELIVRDSTITPRTVQMPTN